MRNIGLGSKPFFFFFFFSLRGGNKIPKLGEIFVLAPSYVQKIHFGKKWSKTTILALSSGQTKNDTPIWGCRHQLDEYMSNEYKSNCK